MNFQAIHPRLLLFLVLSSSTAVWAFHTPLFAYEKYFSWNALLHYLLFYVVIFLCCFVTEKSSLHARVTPGITAFEQFRRKYAGGDALRKEAVALAVVALLGQLLWLVRIVQFKGAGALYQMLIVERNLLAFKEQVVNFTGISGVTTLTQLSLIASALYSVHVFGLRRRGRLGIWALILFPGVLRGMLFSERIALLEVILPILLTAVLFGRLKVTLPRIVAAVTAFVIFFSAAEGLRSYQYHSDKAAGEAGIYAYGIGRLLDYVSSSVNHSMAMVDLSGRKIGFPTLLFNGWISLASIAVPDTTIRSVLHINDFIEANAAVKRSPYSAADYTNMGFFGEMFADTGYLYLIYAVIYGWFVGMAYKGARKFEVGWLAIYPTVCFSLLESYRIHYLFDTRVFYPLLYMFLRYLYVSWRHSRIASSPIPAQ